MLVFLFAHQITALKLKFTSEKVDENDTGKQFPHTFDTPLEIARRQVDANLNKLI